MSRKWACADNIKKYLLFSRINDLNLPARERYQCLRRSLLLIMLSVAMAPVLFTAALSFHQYRQLLKEDTASNARWSTISAKQNIETFLERLQLSISFIAEAYDYDYLTKQERLDEVLESLKQKHWGIVDLSVIGPEGVQRSYAGPFNLVGKVYGDSLWYNKTLAQKSHISEVFMGFRSVPHFVVAISRKMPNKGQGNWVLRASVDKETLDRFVAAINSEIVIDAFLVNREGIPQSSSQFYSSKNGNKINLPDIGSPNNIILTRELRGNKEVLRAYCQIKDTPWILIMDYPRYWDKISWADFKRQIFITLISCTFIIIFVVVRIASFLADAIRRSDEARESLIAQTEHTDRLASIGRLAAGVAHEINNPLAIIGAKTQLMQDLLTQEKNFSQRDKFLAQLDAMRNAVNRSQTITHRLLGFARRMEARREPVNINEVIAEVISFLEREARYQNIRIEQDLQFDLPSISSDHGQLQQILFNIINNAIDAAGKNGKIVIRTRQHNGDSVQIDIVDNGPGMSPEVQKKIFDPFFTTKNDKSKQGTGLGLSITYGLVKKLKGEIEVQSEQGVGTIFTLTFSL
ncbi:MAG: sensor histidine kinase [Thermodesulfobacteriota bacterium]